MATRPCEACTTTPVMRCGRCSTTRCAEHALQSGQRCDGCEHDYEDEAPTRRAAKLIFVPPVAILTGGLVFGILLPLSLGAFGAAVMCAVACFSAAGVGAGACRVVDRSARVMFLRERAGSLPPMRLLPSPRNR